MNWHFAASGAGGANSVSVLASHRGDFSDTACLSLTKRITNIRRLEHHLSLETNAERSCASTGYLQPADSDGAARPPWRHRWSLRSLGRGRAYLRLRACLPHFGSRRYRRHLVLGSGARWPSTAQ